MFDFSETEEEGEAARQQIRAGGTNVSTQERGNSSSASYLLQRQQFRTTSSTRKQTEGEEELESAVCGAAFRLELSCRTKVTLTVWSCSSRPNSGQAPDDGGSDHGRQPQAVLMDQTVSWSSVTV